MKSQRFPVIRPSHLRYIAIAASVVSLHFARAQNIWQPNPSAGPQVWSNAAHWSNGVPGTGSNVLIPAASPLLDINVEIGSLTIEGFGGVRGPKNLTVTGATTLQNTSAHATSIHVATGGVFSLGTLANYSGGVLAGNYTADDSDGPTAPTIVQFRGANVTELQGEIYLFGAGALMRDQETGLNAFRNLALVTSTGFFYLEDAPSHSTTGNLVNKGQFLIYDSIDAAGTSYTVNGSLTNADNGYLEAYGNAQIIVKGNLLNSATGPNGEIFVYNDGDAPAGEAILSVDGDFTNEPGSEITVEGFGGRKSRLIVKGSMTNKGEVTLLGAGSMEVNGVLTVAPASTLTLTGNTGIETFMMTAARIDAAAGSAFGARGTIFADLTEHGVFYPGASPGRVTIKGNIVFGNTAEFRVEVGGTTPDTQYDQVVQQSTGTGGVTLAGKLDIAFVNGFESTVQSSDTFTILTSDVALNGAFSNVANGGRLHTSNGSSSFVVTYNGNSVVLSGAQLEPLTLTGAVSQKFHGNDPYDIALPLTGDPGIECRRGPTADAHDLLFSFSNAVVSGNAAVTGGTGTTSGAIPYQNGLYVPLTGVANGQTITVTLTNVTDTRGQILPTVSVTMKVLLGDTNNDGNVNSGDALQTRNRSGQPASATNFRSDVNTDGTINTGDALIVRSRSGQQ